jgi:hypothetical protein
MRQRHPTSCDALPLHELLNGWPELRSVVWRVDALSWAADTKGSVGAHLLDNGLRTDDEANLLIASRPCLNNALISICDSLLDVESMQVNFPRLGVLNACYGIRHLGDYLTRPKK